MEEIELSVFVCNNSVGIRLAAPRQRYAAGIKQVYAVGKAVMSAMSMAEKSRVTSVLSRRIFQSFETVIHIEGMAVAKEKSVLSYIHNRSVRNRTVIIIVASYSIRICTNDISHGDHIIVLTVSEKNESLKSCFSFFFDNLDPVTVRSVAVGYNQNPHCGSPLPPLNAAYFYARRFKSRYQIKQLNAVVQM